MVRASLGSLLGPTGVRLNAEIAETAKELG